MSPSLSALKGRGRPLRASTEQVTARLDALEQVLQIGGDRLEPEPARRAGAVLGRTGQRLRLGLEHTVVAFAGATGSGKSSLFNAVCGTEVSTVGARRPTTAKATGLVIGEGGDELLDWLGVPRRHRLPATQAAGGSVNLDGLILLDLPDHDSTAVAHRLEVDRLVRLVDLMVWVVDPQKYADDALHSGYLRPLAAHAGVMVVVLNQIDRLPPDQVEACLQDLRRLLTSEGLREVPVLGVSARTGAGLDDLRAKIGSAISAHAMVAARALADLDTAATELASSVADRELDPEKVPGQKVLIDALVGAAGAASVSTTADRPSFAPGGRLPAGCPSCVATRWSGCGSGLARPGPRWRPGAWTRPHFRCPPRVSRRRSRWQPGALPPSAARGCRCAGPMRCAKPPNLPDPTSPTPSTEP
jgi:GTP-binding protein EngB required for normal cell division